MDLLRSARSWTSSAATVIVVDASVVVPAIADDDRAGRRARTRLRNERVHAPQLLDLEVASALRGLALGKRLTEARAASALLDLRQLPIQRAAHRALIGRCWELRDNLTVYDAAYVALAEALGCTLVTADAGLATAPGLPCRVELLGAEV